MRLPITSAFGLAGAALGTVFSQFVPLLTAFILPELVYLLVLWTDAWLAARANAPSYFPIWLLECADLFLSAIVFVAVIRFLILGLSPKLFPKNLPLKAVVLTAIVLIPLWLILGWVADPLLLYRLYFGSQYLDFDSDLSRYAAWLSIFYSFVMHTLAIAIFYPVLGAIATASRFEFATVMAWHRQNFFGIMAFAALLVAAVSGANRIYSTAVWFIAPDIVGAMPTTIEYFDGRLVATQKLLNLPIDFLYVVLPPVAIALLNLGLSRKRTTVFASPAERG